MTIEKLNVNETNEEETVMTEEDKEEMEEFIQNVITIGVHQWKKTKFRIFGKGLIIGLTTAVAIQSLITVFVLLAYLT